MKFLNCGSLNIDHLYRVSRFVKAGETFSTASYMRNCGGKGLNQSVALARAGMTVFHVGCIGEDGAALATLLREEGVDTRYIRTVSTPTGHAIIEVEESGENRILLYGGANQCITAQQLRETLEDFSPGDVFLLQNEINGVEEWISMAHDRGMTVVFNPSPFAPYAATLPQGAVDWYFVNGTEAAALSGEREKESIIAALRKAYPTAHFVYTQGARGATYFDAHTRYDVSAVPATVVDTTAAGDTFTGYFLATYFRGADIRQALAAAASAAALAIGTVGAAVSIPKRAAL